MTVRNRTKQVLSMLLPVGILGISVMLANIVSEAPSMEPKGSERISSVAERLSEIRAGVSEMDVKEGNTPDAENVLLAAWPNFNFGWGNGGWHNWGNGGWGWRNGGWHNWGNGGWGNGGGWHNWHNGGWGNGGGWHNWHNFWQNW